MLKNKCMSVQNEVEEELQDLQRLAELTERLYNKAKADRDKDLYEIALAMSARLKEQSERVYQKSTGEAFIDRAA